MVKRVSLPLGFFAILLYIIFRADTANYNFAFRCVCVGTGESKVRYN